MISLQTVAAQGADTLAVIAALEAQLRADAAPRMIVSFYGCDHDDAALHAWLRTRFPDAALMGGSSSGGFMTEKGLFDASGIGLLLIDDPQGNYGSAASSLGDDPSQTAEQLLRQALAGCGCNGELPEMIWIYQAPGREEAVLAGLRRVVGEQCPILGGSSADNEVFGRWRQLGPQGCFGDGLVVGVLFPASPLGHDFQGGYEPAGPSGIVTASQGRTILRIDDEPAAQVYNRWIDGRIADRLNTGGSILAETTMCPLATDAGRVDGIAHYLLVHPESVGADGALRTFCDLEPGARVYAMRGNLQRLVERAGRVARQARQTLPEGTGEVAGGLVVYCGGCKMAVGDGIPRVAEAMAAGLGAAPFLGCFTFGEQGRMINKNMHGNLMISAVAFGR